MAKVSRYHARGFFLLTQLAAGGLHTLPAAAVSIIKGDILTDDTNGYATNTATAFSAIDVGVAIASVDNSAGAAGAVDVQMIPLLRQYQWVVPVGNNAVITRGYVGDKYDLHNAYSIDLADTTGVASAVGFFIDDFDASTEAVAVTTYGYAIGHFEPHDA